MRKGALLLALFLGCLQAVDAFVVPQKPTGYVNDYANIIDGNIRSQLEEQLRLFTASTTSEISVVTVPDLEGDTIEHYGSKLLESWKIGTTKYDNGVLLLVALQERKVRIEVGYGLEGALPDILASDIINSKITPSFKQGDYTAGIVKGVTAIMQASYGEYKATSQEKKASGNIFDMIAIFIIIAVQFFSSVLARSKSWWAGGVVGAVVGGAITFFGVMGITMGIGFVITVVLALLGLLFDYIVSSTYSSSVTRGGSIPWWAGGGSRGGGSSFGGFSGGSSGGGGASGSW